MVFITDSQLKAIQHTGDRGIQCLGISVVVTMGWVGPEMLENLPQGPGWPPTDNDRAPMSAVPRENTWPM